MKTLSMKHKGVGQSLVEFALTITLLFLFLSAVIDLGLAYFALQGLNGAAQEGATYAAQVPMIVVNGAPATNDAEIRNRVRYEAGNHLVIPNKVTFVNLLDLNNDKAVDTDAQIQNLKLIEIKTVNSYANNASMSRPCSDSPPQRNAQYCEMQVTVRYTYKPFFSAASLLGLGEINMQVTRQQTIGQ